MMRRGLWDRAGCHGRAAAQERAGVRALFLPNVVGEGVGTALENAEAPFISVASKMTRVCSRRGLAGRTTWARAPRWLSRR